MATLPLGILSCNMYKVLARDKLRGLATECGPILDDLQLIDIQNSTKIVGNGQ